MKKLRRKYRRPQKSDDIQERNLEFCTMCTNPMGIKCEQKLCRICCRDKCFIENLDCKGHKIFIKTRREKVKQNEKSNNS